MSDDLGLYIDIRAGGAPKAENDMARVAKTAGKMEKDAKSAERGMDELGKSLKKSGDSARDSGTAFGSLSTILGSIASVAAARSLIRTADDVGAMSARVKLATGNIQEFNYAQEQLLKTANRAGRSLSEMQQIFIDTNGNLRDMGYSMKDSMRITDSFSFALARNAASAQKAQSALSAFDYALNKKTIDVTTWKSISSAIPSLEVDMSRLYNKSLSEIQQLGFDGKLSVEMINNTLLESLSTNEEAIDALGSSVSASITAMMNKSEAFIGGIDKSIGVTSALAKSIDLVGNNIEYLLIPAAGLATMTLIRGFGLARTAVLAFNASLMANPMTLVVASIAMGITALYSLTRETEQSTEVFYEMTDSLDSVIGKFKELGTIQRKAYISDYKDKQIGAMREVENSVDSLVKKMASIAQAEGAAEKKNSGSGWYMRATYIKNADKAIREAIESGKDLLDVVDEFGRFEEIDGVLSDVLIEDIKNLDLATMSLKKYGEALQQMAIEQGTFVGPLQLSIDTSESKAYLDMQEKITQQVAQRNLSGYEGMVLYERSFGVLKDIKDKEFETLQLRAQSADIQARMIAQQETMAAKVTDINTRLAKVGMNGLESEIYDLRQMFPEGDELDGMISKLKIIYGSKASSGGKKTDVFGDRLVSLSEELSTLQALNKEMEIYGKPSLYNSASELTLEFQNQSSALYKLSAAQKEVLLNQAQQVDSQKQLNEIMNMSIDSKDSIDDMRFELELMGLASKEVEKLRFFRDLDTKSKELAIGMSQANIEILNTEIAKIKELYAEYEKDAKSADDDYLKGMRDGINSFLQDAGTAREAFENSTKGAFESMSSSFADFVTTGKMNFKDLAGSIINDIAKIMAKWAMAQAMSGLMGAIGGGVSPGIPYQAWTGGYIPEYAGGGRVNDLSGGGYTGNGGKYEPKGVVHGGEYVLRKEVVPQIGIDKLDRMNKGYFSGGYVGKSTSGSKDGGSGGVTVNIHNNSNSNVSVEEGTDSGGGRSIEVLIEQIIGAVDQRIASNGSTGKVIAQRFSLSNTPR